MQIQTFNRAAVLISSAFPDRKFEPDVFFELLKDLPDEEFLNSVVDIVKTQKELYPGTNLIAILRDRTIELRQQKSRMFPRLEVKREEIEPTQSLIKMFDAEVNKIAKEKSV